MNEELRGENALLDEISTAVRSTCLTIYDIYLVHVGETLVVTFTVICA